MQYDKLMTLTGTPWSKVEEELDRELPADAYKPVPGGASLTDIDPAYMRDDFNRLFGVCGFGWGYDYDVEDISIDTVKRGTQGATAYSAFVKKLTFWVKLLDENGEETTLKVPSSGGSVNDVLGYALSGAITNALGKAASNIGFQKSVYLGLRSHKSVGNGAKSPKPAAASAKKETPGKPAAANPAKAQAPKPQPKQEEPVSDEIIDDQPASIEDGANFEIPFGNRKGQKLGDVDLKYIAWYANDMKVEGDPEKAVLQAHAKALLKVRSNGHAVPA